MYKLTAWNLVNYGKVKEAVSLLEQVVEMEEQTLSEDHPDRLASQHALAGAYQANGQIKEAVSLLKQVVEIREQTLSEDHPSRLASQHELACIRSVHLNLTKAEKQTGRIWTGQEVALKLTYHIARHTYKRRTARYKTLSRWLKRWRPGGS